MQRKLISCIALMFASIALGGASSLAADLVPGASDGFVLTQWGEWTPAEARRAVEDAARVGARDITVIVHMCQSDRHSSDIRWCYARMGEPLLATDQGRRLLELKNAVFDHGMTLSFLPFPMTQQLDSRAWIWPRDRAAWFANYGRMMEELAELSQETGSPRLVVGSELTLLFMDSAAWRDIIRRVRRLYSGHLTLSPVFAQYQSIQFWDALDSIGVSAYFPLTLWDRWVSPWLLEASWRGHKQHLLKFASLWKKPLTFIEVGYPTTTVAATRPWDYEWAKRTYDEEIPRRCWEAFRKVWSKEPRLKSFSIWGLTGQVDEHKAFSPIGKASEPIVHQIFEERATLQ